MELIIHEHTRNHDGKRSGHVLPKGVSIIIFVSFVEFVVKNVCILKSVHNFPESQAHIALKKKLLLLKFPTAFR